MLNNMYGSTKVTKMAEMILQEVCKKDSRKAIFPYTKGKFVQSLNKSS